jgi:hypothetical protein
LDDIRRGAPSTRGHPIHRGAVDLQAALKPTLKELGFKLGKYHGIGGWSGWTREAPLVHEFFWIQINSYGFDRFWGGEFIVEFEFVNRDRHTSTRNRMWPLLDDASRREAFRLINEAVAALPGPSPEMLDLVPESLRSTYLKRFEIVAEVPPANQHVWFRYATRAGVEAWADFLASRLKGIVIEGEATLQTMPESSAIFMGAFKKREDELWTSPDS